MVWTFDLIEEVERVPETYLKQVENTDGLYEIRIQQGSDIFRIFCFFHRNNLIVLANGFQKKTQQIPKGEIDKALKIKKDMNQKTNNIMILEEFKERHYGKIRTPERDELEVGYENFKLGVLLQQARHEKGLTQEELAQRTGTTKSYISKIENGVKEVRLSTLQKIVELGLEGKLQLSIQL
ncbi:hypothetical protein EZS27_000578 [termite gut metagenome]|uniref:HTH cro/C1-type domain-containing protein n=1 Tax=termite gut metagenome TaxID=433724 RepID=A0A5J4T3L7_9ZZZZ